MIHTDQPVHQFPCWLSPTLSWVGTLHTNGGGLAPLVSLDSCVAYSTEECRLIVGIRRGRGGTGGTPGKLGILTQGGQSG
jgi:hypothetical protein